MPAKSKVVKEKDPRFDFLDSSLNLQDSALDFSALNEELGTAQDEESDPFKGAKYTGRPEHDTKADLNEVHKAFREARKREMQQRQEFADGAFFFCVVFESRMQKAELLEKLGAGDENTVYVSGFELARVLGIKMESPRLKFTTARNDSSWSEEIGTFE